MSVSRGAGAEKQRGKYLFVGAIALVIVIADQLTKLWIAGTMTLHESIPVIPGFFDLTYVRNTGAAFSMFSGQPEAFRVPFFTLVSLVAGAAIVYFVHNTPATQRWVLLACGLVLGGALGNLIDRVAYGEVIDFLDVYWQGWHWPAFNVADSCITVGVGILLLQAVMVRD